MEKKTVRELKSLFIEELEKRATPAAVWNAAGTAAEHANYHSPIGAPIITTLALCEEDAGNSPCYL